MDSSRKWSSSNKIREIVKIQQILKKWKRLANNNGTGTGTTTIKGSSTTGSSNSRSNINKFLKKTLSFSESSNGSSLPKGYIAVCVGKELKRFVIPTEYLSHNAFGILLTQAAEEFGFQQEGVLKFPCEVDLFHNILKTIQLQSSHHHASLLHEEDHNYSPDHTHHHSQICV